MFPIFLFLVVFSFYCWLAYESQLMSSQQRTGLAATKTTPPVQPTDAFPMLLESKSQALEPKSLVAPLPKLISKTEVNKAIPTAISDKQVEMPKQEIVLETHLEAVPEKLEAELTTELSATTAPEQKLVLDDIATLRIRDARKVASTLGIRQKANGADKSLNCLQQEIRQQFKNQPELVVQDERIS